MRKDAERNREKLIEAAREIMLAGGADAPMEDVAVRAGLTRGTLYRNFADREAMYVAVLESEFAMIGERLEKDKATHPLAFIKSMTELIMLYDNFLNSLADMTKYDVKRTEAWFLELIAAPLSTAQDISLLGLRISRSDILLVCRMLAPHGRVDQQPDLSAVINPRMNLLLRGIAGSIVGRSKL
ncbi:MAG: TetR/AcrR family transcriptional regulator [Cypionkella sp.]